MKEVANIIDEALGVIDPVEKELSIASHKTVVPRPSDNLEDLDADYKYQRENFYNLIKQVAEVTEKLGDLQEKMKRLKEVPNTAPKNVTNALFVGSTAELQKVLKDKK